MISEEKFKELFDVNNINSSDLFKEIPDLEGIKFLKDKNKNIIIINGKEFINYDDNLPLGVL